MPKRYAACYKDEIKEGRSKIVTIAGRSIGLFNVGGEIYAVHNRCPHKGAPLCRGTITGKVNGDRPGDLEMVSEGDVIRCPWHGWEFDIRSGESVFNPHAVQVRKYTVDVAKSDDNAECADVAIETFPVDVAKSETGSRATVFVEV